MALTCTHAMYLNASTPINASTSKYVLNPRALEFRPVTLLVPRIGKASAITVTEQEVVSPAQRNQKRPVSAMSQKLEITDLGPDDYTRNQPSVCQKILAMASASSRQKKSIGFQMQASLPFDTKQEDVQSRQQFKNYFESLSFDDKQLFVAAINAGKPVEYAMDVSRSRVKTNKRGEKYTTYVHTPFVASIQFPRPHAQIEHIDQLPDFLQKNEVKPLAQAQSLDQAAILQKAEDEYEALHKAAKKCKDLEQVIEEHKACIDNHNDVLVQEQRQAQLQEQIQALKKDEEKHETSFNEVYEAFLASIYGNHIGKSKNPYEMAMDKQSFTPRKRVATEVSVMQSDVQKDCTASVLSDKQKEEQRILERKARKAQNREREKAQKKLAKQQQKAEEGCVKQQSIDLPQTICGASDNDYRSSGVSGTEFSADQIDVILAASSLAKDGVMQSPVDDITEHVSMIDLDDAFVQDISKSSQKSVRKPRKKTKKSGEKAGKTEEDQFLDELLSGSECERNRKQRVERLIADYENALNQWNCLTFDKSIRQKESQNNLLKKVEKSVQAIFTCNQEFKAIGYCFADYVPFDKYTEMQNTGDLISNVFNYFYSSESYIGTKDTAVIVDMWKIIEPLYITGSILHRVDKTAVQQPQLKVLKQMRKDLGQPTRISNSMSDDQALTIFKKDLKYLLLDHDDNEINRYEIMGQQFHHRLKEGKINSDVFHVDIAKYIENDIEIIDADKKKLLIASLVDFVIRS